MTTYATPGAPPVIETAVPPRSAAPQSPRGGRGRAPLAAAAVALVICAISAAVTGIALSTPAKVAVNTVIVSPTFTAEQTAAAKKQACDAWAITKHVLVQAATVVANAPPTLSDPVTQEAYAAEARATLVETAYLRNNLTPATPAEVRIPLNEYLAATFDQEDATTNLRWQARDDAIDRSNEATHRANAACRKI